MPSQLCYVCVFPICAVPEATRFARPEATPMPKLYSSLLVLASLLAVSPALFADSVLLGSDLTQPTAGASLCPSYSDCSVLQQQFTLTSAATVNQLQLVLEVPGPFGPGGSFSVSLDGTTLGSGFLFAPDQNPLFDTVTFNNLDLSLAPGDYSVQVSGGDLSWAHATSSGPGTAGFLDQGYTCDPTVQCIPQAAGQFEMALSGTTVDSSVALDSSDLTPEPSAWLLLGTGTLLFAGALRRKALH